MGRVTDYEHDNPDKPAATPTAPRGPEGPKTGRPHRNSASPSGEGGTRSQPNKLEKLAMRRTLRMVKWLGAIPAKGSALFVSACS
jgi:hypothetical protein